MRLRIALSLAMAIAGAAAILGAPSIPMRHVAAVVVAAGCLALAMSVTILATLRAPRVTAFAICTVTATALVLAVALVDLVTPYRNNRTGRSVELWDPRENALDQFETLNFSYNRQGWRTAREAEAFRAGHDILLLGDSVAFGIVSDGQTIESHLRHMLTQARAERDTSTLAVPGVGLTTYQALSEIAAPMRPAWAYLFIYVDNDFTHSVEFDLPWVARILYTSPSLRALSELPTLLWGLLDRAAQPPAAPAAPPEGATLPEYARHLQATGRGINPRNLTLLALADEALYAKYARTAAHPQVGRILAQISRNLGGRFCAVLVPSKYQVYAGYEWTLKPLGFRPGARLPTAIQHAVEASGTQHGYCVLNPFTAVIDRERTERLYYAVDDHPNAAGNCVLARQVFVDLAARDLAGSTLAAPDCAPQ